MARWEHICGKWERGGGCLLQIEAKGGYGCVDGLGEALAEGSRNDGGAVIFERERDRSSSRPKICLSFAGAALAGQLTAQRPLSTGGGD